MARKRRRYEDNPAQRVTRRDPLNDSATSTVMGTRLSRGRGLNISAFHREDAAMVRRPA
jgi:hypothetical protein